MGRMVVYADFDGVLNVFSKSRKLPKDENAIAQNEMVEDYDPELFSLERSFPVTDRKKVDTPIGRFPIRWSSELVDLMYSLALSEDTDFYWLSTWQPFSHILNDTFNWDPEIVKTVNWFNAISGEGIHDGKLGTVLGRIWIEKLSQDPSPIIWIDDEKCDREAYESLKSVEPPAPVLIVRPDCHIGISRRQWDLISGFVADSRSFDTVTLDEESSYQYKIRMVQSASESLRARMPASSEI